jgi:signal transduction histidine kinase/CheY-like chemotaxis protein
METLLQSKVQAQHAVREHVRSFCYEHANLLHHFVILLILLIGSLDFIIAQNTWFGFFSALRICAILGLLLILLREFRSRHRLTLTRERLRLLDQERAGLFEREKKRTAQLLVMHAVGRTFSSILDFYAVFKEFANLLQISFGYEHVSIFGLDDRGQLVLKALVDKNPDPLIPDAILGNEKSEICRARNLGKALLSEVLDNQSRLESALHQGTRSQLCIPFRYSSQTLGVINVESEKDQAFAEEDITFLQTLSDYLAIWVNNANFYNEIGRKASALQALNNIGKAVRLDLNINDFFELIFREVGQVMPSEDFFIALYEKKSNRIEVCFGMADGRRESSLNSISHDDLVGYVLQTRTPLLANDNFAKVYKDITGRTPSRVAHSWLGVPLILGEEPLGVIVLQNFKIRQTYDGDDLKLLSTVAAQAALAISNARVLREARERGTRLAVVKEITREASLNLEIDKLFEKINTQLKRVLSFEKSSIAIYQPQTDTFSLLNVYGENITAGFYRGMEISGRETVMKIAYDTKRPYYSRSLDQTLSSNSPHLVTQGIRSAVSIPIVSEDVCLGTLNLGSQKEDGFGDDEMDLLVTIANSLGTTLKNARLYSALEQSYSELQNTHEQLIKSEKLRALGEMSAGLAHDFNNILGAILGRAQLMKGQTSDAAALRGLGIIEKAAIDGASTVKRLQDFTRTRTDPAYKEVNLVQVIEDTISMTRTRWEDSAHVNGIQYSITTQYEPVLPIAGDSSELREVFTNIIFNALDAMPNGGKVHFHVGTREDRVFASIADTGRGMTKGVCKKIFDPFFTTKGVKGNGLGMSVAYGIISRHKGEIEVESELGKGTTIRVILPINSNPAHQSSVAAVSPQRKTGRFLIIDDEAPIRELLAEMLIQQGHIVFTASGGKEGLEILKNQVPDLVITDLGMPEVSGWDVAAIVKAVNSSISVVLMTGWGITLDKEIARKKGVDVVVGKPFQIADIQKVLNEMLELHYKNLELQCKSEV